MVRSEANSGWLEREIQTLQAENRSTMHQLEVCRFQKDETIAALRAENKEIEKMVTALKTENKEKGELRARLTEKDGSLKTHNRESNTSKLNTDKVQLQKQLQQEKQRVLALETKLAECTKEKNDALSRLSVAVSVQLRDNNPDIVDLGDCHRPEKLVEISNEIYDNEWADAFEQLDDTGMEEAQYISLLLEIIMVCHDYCNKLTHEQLSFINQWIAPDKEHKSILPVLKTLKDARKCKALDLLPKIEKDCRLYLQQSIDQLTKEPIKSLDKVNTYTSACIKLCWLMAVQDPPCIFVCPVSKPKRTPTIQNGYKGYYGQTLEDPDEENFVITNAFSDDKSHIVAENRPEFDKKFYKDYTQSGQYVQYSVWPCMLLQENGRLLSKGIVQCCDKQ